MNTGAELKAGDPPESSSAEHSYSTEEICLSSLKSRGLPPEAIEIMCREHRLLLGKSRKLRLAVVEHPRTPRHIALPMLRQLFTIELMQIALDSSIAADLRVAAEEALINRLESISAGERITLAKRASGRVAGALLNDVHMRVMRAALENGRVTEAVVVKALRSSNGNLVDAVCRHAKWSVRREVRIALVSNDKTPLEFVLKFARSLPAGVLRDIFHASHLPEPVRAAIQKRMEAEVQS